MNLRSQLQFLAVLTLLTVAAKAQDSRTVTEPTFPAVCTQVAAETTISANEPASETDDTLIQTALKNCASGKAVELTLNSNGNNAFVIAPIYIPSGVSLIVDGGVTVFASKNAADYQIGTVSSSQDQCGTVGPNGNGCNPLITIGESSVNGTSTSTGSGLMGYGVINGRGGDKITVNGSVTTTSWWDLANLARSGGSQNNPVMVAGYKSNSGVIYKITLLNGPIIHVNLHYNNGFTAWGMKILTPYTARNAAGFSPNSDSNITLTNSVIGDGDDEVAINASNDPVTNLTFSNSLFSSGHGLSIGSITTDGVSNMLVNHVNFSGQAADSNQEALHIKSDVQNGGLVNNITYENICIKNVYQPIQLDAFYNTNSGTNYPQYTNITFANVHVVSGSVTPHIELEGYSSSYVSSVTLDNVVFDTTPSISPAWQDATITFSDAISGTSSPVVYPASLTTNAGTGVSYASSATVSNASAYSCPTSGTSNAFPTLVGELYASYGGVNNVNQAFTATNPTSIVLNAMVQPTNSETSYAYSGYGTYTGVAAPTAGVQFYDGGVAIGSPVSLSQNGTFATLTVTNPSVGAHTYTAQYVGDSNYAALSFGSLTVTVVAGAAAQLAITTAPPSSLAYGVAPGTVKVAVQDGAGDQTTSTASVTLTVTGPNSYAKPYTVSAVAGVATFSLSSSLPQIGSYNYVASGTGLTSSSTASESVTAATLTATAQPAARIFDTANPVFGYGITGYQNGDTIAVVSGAPVLSTTAVPDSPATTYPIIVAVGTLSATNYVFATVGNTLTVDGGAPQAIVFAALPNLDSGASYQLTARTTSGLPVTYSVSGAATVSGSTLTVTGKGAVTVTAANSGNASYAAATNVQQGFTAQ